jgi:hypothetical protein
MPCRPARVVAASLFALLIATGCAAWDENPDFHRHAMSDLREDWRRPGVFLFEASSSTQFPADSEAGEQERMTWLAGWMRRTGYCPAGWEVLSRSKIAPAEVHARRHDLRYEVRCVSPEPTAGH